MCIEGGRRKPFNDKLDESVLEWIHERRSKSLQTLKILIM